MASKKIFITGVSGTGKTTVCRELQKRGFNTIGIDETEHLSYWVHRDSGEPYMGDVADFNAEFLKTHGWICDMDVLRRLVDQVDGKIVICGNVENVLEVIDYCDTTLLLQCSPETFVARIKAREDNEYGQSEDSKNFLLSYYDGDNVKCLEAGAIAIDTEQSIEDVVAEVVKHINQ